VKRCDHRLACVRSVGLTLGALVALMPFPAGAQSPEANFWRWFRQNEPALLLVQTGREPVCGQLAVALQTVSPELTFEFGPAEHERREFIISADGIRDAFPAVKRLAAAAPSLEHWTVIAFRPGRPGPHVLTVGALTMTSADILVHAEPDGERTGLVLAMPGYHATPAKSYEQAAYLLLDALIGEYAVETRIGFIEFVDSKRKDARRWIPLEEFATRARQP